MKKNRTSAMARRTANAYLSSVISISLVLFLVGISSLLLVNASRVADYFKEHMKVSAILGEDVTDEAAEAIIPSICKVDGVRGAEMISREQGRREMADLLGQDFLSVFSVAPIPVSVDITLRGTYVCADSLEVLEENLLKFAQVDEVVYQSSLVDAMNANMGRISVVMGILTVLLLIVSVALIANTVRLNVYARRFTVHTMKMVGATRAFIRRPFLIQGLFQGIFASLLAIIMVEAVLLFLKGEFPQMFTIFTVDLLALVMGIILASGIAICVLSTYFVVNRLLSWGKDELYF